MKKQTTKGAFGNNNAKKLTLKTKLGALFFRDLKSNQAVSTPPPPNGIYDIDPFEMGGYLQDLKKNAFTPKSIDKVLTFNYIKGDSSEIGDYKHTSYTYSDVNFDVMFIELVKLNNAKLEVRKNGLIANEKYFRSIAKILTSGSKHAYMLNGNVYSCEVVNGIFIVPDKDAYDTLKGMTAPTFHSQIRLQ